MKKFYLEKLSKTDDKGEIIKSLLDGEKLEVEFIYKSDFSFTKDLRDFVEVIGDIFGLSKIFVAKLILITDELNNNAIEHGSSKDGENILRIILYKKDCGKYFLNLEVQDNGKGKDAATALEMETLRAHKLKRGYSKHDSIRGRGLFLIIVKIADRLYFKNAKKGGLIVGIKKEFEKDSKC